MAKRRGASSWTMAESRGAAQDAIATVRYVAGTDSGEEAE